MWKMSKMSRDTIIMKRDDYDTKSMSLSGLVRLQGTEIDSTRTTGARKRLLLAIFKRTALYSYRMTNQDGGIPNAGGATVQALSPL
jgi:hypothetical protein